MHHLPLFQVVGHVHTRKKFGNMLRLPLETLHARCPAGLLDDKATF